jgi:hypothetical protein
MIITFQFARGIVLSLAAAGLVGIAAAAAGEGPDVGRQPPYGYYPGERGRAAPDAYSGPTASGSENPRARRTVHPRARR